MQTDTPLTIPMKPEGESHQETIARARAVKVGAFVPKTDEEIMELSLAAHRALLFSDKAAKDIWREMLYTYGRMHIWPDDLVRAKGVTRSNAVWAFSASEHGRSFQNVERWIVYADGKPIRVPRDIQNGSLLTLVGVREPEPIPEATPVSLPLFLAHIAEEPTAPTALQPAPVPPPTMPPLHELEAAFAVLAQILGKTVAPAPNGKEGHG